MNKAVLAGAVVVGLGVCVAGAAAFSGHAVVDQLSQQSHDLSKLFPTFKVVKEQRSSGLFSSTYDVTFQLGCLPIAASSALGAAPSAKPTPIELGFHHDIKHGPVPGGKSVGLATIDSRLVLPTNWQAQLQKIIGSQQLLALHTSIDMTGGYDSEFRLPAVTVSDQQGGMQLKAISGHARGKRPKGAGKLPYSAEIPSVELTAQLMGQQVVFKMNDLKSSGELSYDPNAISWFGDGKTSGSVASCTLVGSLPSLDGSPARPLNARIDNLTFGSTSSIDKGLWSTSSQLSGKGKVNDTTIDKLEMQASMKRIEAVAYQRIVQTLLSSALSCDPATQAAAPSMLLTSASRQAASLLKHDPEYALDKLAVELAGRRAELSYSVGSKGVTDADLAAGSPEALAQKAVVRGAAKIHIGLIDQAISSLLAAMPAADPGQAPQQGGLAAAAGAMPSLEIVHATIDQFVQLGYLSREGDYVSVSAGMEAGQVLINGKPMQLPTFGLPTGP